MPILAPYHLHKEFPDLPSRALDFFHPDNGKHGKNEQGQRIWLPRTIMEFAEDVARPRQTPDSEQFPRFHQLNQICQRLADVNLLTVFNRGTWDSHDASYFWTNDLLLMSDKEKDDIRRLLNYIVYGFVAIFEDFKNSILPIVHYDSDENRAVGTAFVIRSDFNLLFTAAHCVTGAKALSLRGVSSADFRAAEIFVSKNNALDIAMILFDHPVLPDAKRLELGHGKILDDVIAIGYPNVPTFAEVLAVEKATIASELTGTKGIIVSNPTEIFSKAPMYLISARVRGGFSGGPIINDRGLVVGMVLRQPISEISPTDSIYAQYDNLGYGIAIPTEHILAFTKGVYHRDQSVYEKIEIREYREIS